ncbi:uncharacterized protein LOC131032330 isoform X2 [Cryptomeria japonica]|uniref:uncharacterized protein LOC131032330 isoform X2 n=1 Tax=Cryptomeria japonica TaxID=3369 RepID=UPI0025ABEFAB|nr:uncharacterized protein LOC131032330 isoform X2 [Cryptomeria japonica]
MVLPTLMSSRRPWPFLRVPSKLDAGLATTSGMGALVAAILSICKAGDHILAQFDCYGVSREFLEIDAPRFGIKTQFIDVHNVQTLEFALKNSVIQRETVNGSTLPAENNKNNIIVFLESVTNPCVRVADLQSISTVCKMYGAFLIVDNTFPTPLKIKPLKQGADMVIHSVTKFLGGHSDLVAGVLVGSSHHIELASKLAGRWGLIAAPFDSWLATKGITTLQVRMERALSTTAELARRILCSSIPRKLNWTPDCAMMSIELPGGLDGASRALSSFKMIKFAPSLGGTTTTVSHPVSTSHKSVPPAEREAMGITDGMIRLSIGLEDVEDIWIDIERGLFAAAATEKTSDC